jgi:hypothetical protein
MNGHTLTPSRSHARPSALSRLADRFRGHGDLPEALEPLPALPPEPEPWWGLTELDNPPVHHRPYVPGTLGQYPPAVTAPDPGPQADLGTCLIFRATVHAVFVRQEEARGFRAPDVPWHERYAGLYRARTAEPVIGCFGIADAARQAHEEAKAALAADVRDRIDRITAPAERETEEVAA